MNTNNKIKKQKEKFYLDMFLKLGNDIPKINWVPDESPDFICFFNNYRIGLELINFTLDIGRKRLKIEKIQKAQKRVLELVKKKLIKDNITPLIIEVHFKNYYKKIDIDNAKFELYEIIKNNIGEIINHKRDIISKYYYNKKYVDWIQIYSCFYNNSYIYNEISIRLIIMGYPLINIKEYIQYNIDKKNIKITEYYKKCDKCWLLIGINKMDLYMPIMLSNDLIKYEFNSKFDRVYILEMSEKKLLKLKIKQVE